MDCCVVHLVLQSGFFRMFLIYFISGIGGYIWSGIFAPSLIAMGADPAVYGLLGVMLVELFQSWQIVPKPGQELAKLGCFIFISLFIGTFPQIDNWSHIGGFIFGEFSADSCRQHTLEVPFFSDPLLTIVALRGHNGRYFERYCLFALHHLWRLGLHKEKDITFRLPAAPCSSDGDGDRFFLCNSGVYQQCLFGPAFEC